MAENVALTYVPNTSRPAACCVKVRWTTRQIRARATARARVSVTSSWRSRRASCTAAARPTPGRQAGAVLRLQRPCAVRVRSASVSWASRASPLRGAPRRPKRRRGGGTHGHLRNRADAGRTTVCVDGRGEATRAGAGCQSAEWLTRGARTASSKTPGRSPRASCRRADPAAARLAGVRVAVAIHRGGALAAEARDSIVLDRSPNDLFNTRIVSARSPFDRSAADTEAWTGRRWPPARSHPRTRSRRRRSS